jgi:predicted transcriptional regulator
MLLAFFVNEARTYAWIFLSVSEQPAPLTDIIAVADGINHAIPTQSELQQSFRWLQEHDLVRKEGKRYSLTAGGLALRDRASSPTIMKTWENVAEHFRRDEPNI